MSSLLMCGKHGIKKECYGGCNAHIDNWYCPKCTTEEMLKRNLVAVNMGALQLALNSLERDGKQEIANAVREACFDMDTALEWYAENKPKEYMKHVSIDMINQNT